MKILTDFLARFKRGPKPFEQPSVKIGFQTWAIKNLDVDTFKNGEAIPVAKSIEKWEKANDEKKPAWCYYDNDPENGAQYGKLYNWYAVNDSRGLAQPGWHIPSDSDWNTLINFLGGPSVAGGKLKEADPSHWRNPNVGADNSSGFTGLPGGKRDYQGTFESFGFYSAWWTSTEANAGNAYVRYLLYTNVRADKQWYDKRFGFTVRCLRN